MKLAPLVLAALLVGSALALVPSAEARTWCTAADGWCPGLVCTYDRQWRTWNCVGGNIDCVRDECWGWTLLP